MVIKPRSDEESPYNIAVGGGVSVGFRTGKRKKHGLKECEINFIQAAAHERRGDGAEADAGGGGLVDLLGALGVLGGEPEGAHGAKGQTVTEVVTVTRAAAKPTVAVGDGSNGTCATVQTVTVTEQVAAGSSGYASDSTLILKDVLI